MDVVRSLRLVTLKGIADESLHLDNDAQWRMISRWFSREFSTPLKDVDDLPQLDVIRHYLEDSYLKMSPEELDQEIDEILKDVGGLEGSLNKSKAKNSDEQFAKDAEEEAKAIDLKGAKLVKKEKKKEESVDPRILEALASLGASLGDLSDNEKSKELSGGFGLDALDAGEES